MQIENMTKRNYIIYNTILEGYYSNKIKHEYNKLFSLAVIFKSKALAEKRASYREGSVVIPVTVTLDSKDLFEAKLSGRNIS